MWQIKFKEGAIKDLQKHPRNIVLTIKKAINERLAVNPHSFKTLVGDLKGRRRMRVGDFRIIYEIHESIITVLILKISPRSSVYK
jgi:mRNA interferase RelE/StbE